MTYKDAEIEKERSEQQKLTKRPIDIGARKRTSVAPPVIRSAPEQLRERKGILGQNHRGITDYLWEPAVRRGFGSVPLFSRPKVATDRANISTRKSCSSSGKPLRCSSVMAVSRAAACLIVIFFRFFAILSLRLIFGRHPNSWVMPLAMPSVIDVSRRVRAAWLKDKSPRFAEVVNIFRSLRRGKP